eukprot:scaffold36404_cov49-Attheya_sp.AAC.7
MIMNSLRLILRQGSLSVVHRSVVSPMVPLATRSFSAKDSNLDRLRTVVADVEEGKNPEFVDLAHKTGKLKPRRPWLEDPNAPELPPAVGLEEEISELDSEHNLGRLRGVVHAVEDGKKPEFFEKAKKQGKELHHKNIAKEFSVKEE